MNSYFLLWLGLIIYCFYNSILNILILKKGHSVKGKVVAVHRGMGRYGHEYVGIRVRFKVDGVQMEKKARPGNRHIRQRDYVKVAYWEEWPARCVLVDWMWQEAAVYGIAALLVTLVFWLI